MFNVIYCFHLVMELLCITVDNNHLSALSRNGRERMRKKNNKRKEIDFIVEGLEIVNYLHWHLFFPFC